MTIADIPEDTKGHRTCVLTSPPMNFPSYAAFWVMWRTRTGIKYPEPGFSPEVPAITFCFRSASHLPDSFVTDLSEALKRIDYKPDPNQAPQENVKAQQKQAKKKGANKAKRRKRGDKSASQTAIPKGQTTSQPEKENARLELLVGRQIRELGQ